jgi:hypothetical protein
MAKPQSNLERMPNIKPTQAVQKSEANVKNEATRAMLEMEKAQTTRPKTGIPGPFMPIVGGMPEPSKPKQDLMSKIGSIMPPPSNLEKMPRPPLREPAPAPDPFRRMGEASLGVMVYGPDGKSYGSPLAAKNAGVTNPLRQPPAGVPIKYGPSPKLEADKFMPMPGPGMPPSAGLKPGGAPLPPRGPIGDAYAMGKPMAPQMMSAPPPNMTPEPRFKKGGAISLKDCKVSTTAKNKASPNW